MNTHSARSGGRVSGRGIIAIASCVFGLGLIIFGFGTASTKKDAPSETTPVAQTQKKPARAWNMALGNVVVVAQELGFGIQGATDDVSERSKIVTRIESQLQHLREIYRQESETNPSLMGGMTLQFNVDPAGEVSQIKEISSRITDTEFKKTVIDEVSKWSFQDLVSDRVTVNCPLLFVREGMDISTLVQWEKSLGQTNDKGALAKSNMQPTQQSKATPHQGTTKTVATVSAKPSISTVAKSGTAAYQIKYATALRKEPNFPSPIVGNLTIGTKVHVIERRGDWLEVSADNSGLTGYIRHEFVTSIEMATK
jgi:hypothetical protein